MTEIACAAFVRGGEILLAKRSDHKARYPGHWDLVGGHVEPGENPQVALIREAQEEVGLTPIEFRLVRIAEEANSSGTASTRYHVYAVTKWSGGDPQLLGDEHTEIIWIAPELIASLAPLAHPEYSQIFKALLPATDAT